ncbi:MAG TPA: CsgG/HfaB family protein [Oceanipulchritudo sp.]|nr:CsgG/HfaB family protein [Oceanipulchritudo sp.]
MRKLFLSLLLSTVLMASTPGHAFLGNALKKDAESEDGKSQIDLPEYTGIKHAIAVTDFKNEQNWRAQIELGGALAAMLESSLFESGRFVLVERGDLGDVVMEQDLQASGRAAESTETAQTGLIRSAKYLATGDITRVSGDTQGSGGGIGIKGFRIGVGGSKSELELVVKLIDTTSSTVVASKRILGKAGGSRLSLGYVGSGFAGDLGGFAETPLGEAAQDAIASAVEWIAMEMEDYEVTANVVMVRNPEMIVINRGENFGIASGTEFVIREKGEILTDPATGEVLDVFEGEVTGRIRVNRVSEKVSYAELVDGAVPNRGDAVVFQP